MTFANSTSLVLNFGQARSFDFLCGRWFYLQNLTRKPFAGSHENLLQESPSVPYELSASGLPGGDKIPSKDRLPNKKIKDEKKKEEKKNKVSAKYVTNVDTKRHFIKISK